MCLYVRNDFLRWDSIFPPMFSQRKKKKKETTSTLPTALCSISRESSSQLPAYYIVVLLAVTGEWLLARTLYWLLGLAVCGKFAGVCLLYRIERDPTTYSWFLPPKWPPMYAFRHLCFGAQEIGGAAYLPISRAMYVNPRCVLSSQNRHPEKKIHVADHNK